MLGIINILFLTLVAFASVSQAQTKYIDTTGVVNISLGSVPLWIDETSNRVGIGTSVPLTSLHVNGTGLGDAGFLVTNRTAPIFYVNSTSGEIGIGTTNTTQKLTIEDGGITQNFASGALKTVSGAELGADGLMVSIYGKYAFIAKSYNLSTCSGTTLDGCEIAIYDISDPKNVRGVSGIDRVNTINSVTVYGKYLYIASTDTLGTCSGTTINGCEFAVYDISNISSPVPIGGVEFDVDTGSIFISGKYAFVSSTGVPGACSGTTLDGCEIRIYDISNPYRIRPVSGIDTGGVNVYYAEVYDKYIYVSKVGNAGTCSGTTLQGCEFSIYDISNISSPINVSGVDLGGLVFATVSGSYAFVITQNNFYIYNISNPNSITEVSTFFVNPAINQLKIAGRYAFLTSSYSEESCPGMGCEIKVVDIGDLNNPRLITGADMGNETLSIDIQGKYLYAVTYNTISTEFRIIDLGGLDFPVASIGMIESNKIDIFGNAYVGSALTVGDSLIVGRHGIYSQGPLSLFSRTYSNIPIFEIINSRNMTLLSLQDTGGLGINTTATQGTLLQINSSGGRLYYTDVGRLGIMNETGSSAMASNMLTLRGNTNSTFMNITDGIRTFGIFLGTLSGGPVGASLGTMTSSQFRLYTNNQDRLTIDEGGRVGINTTSPTQTLTVVGSGNFTSNITIGSISGGSSNVSGITLYNESGRPWCLRVPGESTSLQVIEGSCGG